MPGLLCEIFSSNHLCIPSSKNIDRFVFTGFIAAQFANCKLLVPFWSVGRLCGAQLCPALEIFGHNLVVHFTTVNRNFGHNGEKNATFTIGRFSGGLA